MTSSSKELISIVIPTFNEEGNIVKIYTELEKELKEIYPFELIFVNDGSTDKSLEVILNLAKKDSRVKYIDFSRNFGHQAALRAGLKKASGACTISLDADLQHPPKLIPEMLKKWKEGYQVVYTIRDDTNSQTSYFKKITSLYFYRLINKLSDTEIEQGAADFRLLDSKVLNDINSFQEKDIFFRGLSSWVGYRQFKINYTPNPRLWGETKYSFKRMILFAITGITSFSTRPLTFSIIIGVVISAFTFIYALYALYIKIFTDEAISGWSSLIVSVLFIGGVQMIILGIIGQYIGKIFLEVKGRPDYLIKDES